MRLGRLRSLCLALPEVVEVTEGSPALENHARDARKFRVRSRTFVWYLDNHHGDGREAVWCKAAPGVAEVFVGSDDHRFFIPPYLGRHGWIGVRLDMSVNWAVVEDIVADSYRLVAPRPLGCDWVTGTSGRFEPERDSRWRPGRTSSTGDRT
jgi:predicted DNA-binding protein (MmcQ/YjbR family)